MEATSPPFIPEIDENDPTQLVQTQVSKVCQFQVVTDLLAPRQYDNRLEGANNMAIRFGGSNDMLTLMEGDADEQTKYLVGLVATSLVVAVFFLVWSIFLCCFRCTGFRRVGFLCGRFVRPKEPENPVQSDKWHDAANPPSEQAPPPEAEATPVMAVDYADKEIPLVDLNTTQETAPLVNTEDDGVFADTTNEENGAPRGELEGVMQQQAYLDWEEFCRKQDKRIHRTRIVSFFSILCIMVASILFCVYGYRYVNRSIDSGKGVIGEMQETVGNVIKMIDIIKLRQESSELETERALQEGNAMCPEVRDLLCTKNQDGFFDCDTEGIPFLQDELAALLQAVYGLKSWLFDQLINIREELQEMYDDLDSVVNSANDVAWAFWISFSFACAICVQCCAMLFALYAVHSNKGFRLFRFYRRHILFPVFIIFVILAVVFAISFILLTVGLSDVCINSPDPKVNWILDETEGSFGDSPINVVWDFARYYTNRCSSDLVPTAVTDHIDALTLLIDKSSALVSKTSEVDGGEWQEICGSDINIVQSFGDAIGRTTCQLAQLTEDLKRLSWCRNWNPIYTQFMYKTVCYDVQAGLAWVAATMLFIVVFSFVVLLLRAALFEVEDEDEFEVGVRQFVHCCKRRCCSKRAKGSVTSQDPGPNANAGPAPADDNDSFASAQEVHLT